MGLKTSSLFVELIHVETVYQLANFINSYKNSKPSTLDCVVRTESNVLKASQLNLINSPRRSKLLCKISLCRISCSTILLATCCRWRDTYVHFYQYHALKAVCTGAYVHLDNHSSPISMYKCLCRSTYAVCFSLGWDGMLNAFYKTVLSLVFWKLP